MPHTNSQCLSCHVPLVRTEKRSAYLKRMGFRFGDEIFALPEQEYCAICLHQRRLAFRNERNLYHRESCVTGDRILSLYHPEPLWGAPYEVMLESDWRSEKLDAFAHGRPIDFTRPFFEQYAALHKSVPRMSIVNLQNENSPFTSHTGYSKNCYLLPCSEHCQDCYYGRFLQECSDCVDCTTACRCQLCYECFQIADCYRCAFLSLSDNCNECYFSENLIGCRYCLFCSNLRRAEYCIFNQQVSPEKFRSEAAKILSSAREIEAARAQWSELRASRIRLPANIRNCENCAGDFLLDSRDCTDCIDVTGCEDCSDVIIGYKLRDCVNCSNLYIDSELNYEILGSAQLYHCAFGFYVFRSSDVLYSEYIYDSKRLFGCIGLTRAENCILNTQYSKAEYEKTAQRLVRHMIDSGEWGRHFTPQYSPFGYNETVASDFIPLPREAALARGFLWRETPPKPPGTAQIHPPDAIHESGAEAAQKVYTCRVSGEQYKIITAEFEFHKKHGIALPQLAPKQRHLLREQLRFPAKFRAAHCPQCNTAVQTNVPAELAATLRCEECYLKLVQ